MGFEEDLRKLADRVPAALRGPAEWTLRLVDERSQWLAFRQDILQPVRNTQSRGAMLTVFLGGGLGYAATSDLSRDGIEEAARRALGWAETSTGRLLFDTDRMTIPAQRGRYEQLPAQAWDDSPLEARLERVRQACASLQIHDDIVDWSAYLGHRQVRTGLASSRGGEIVQSFRYLMPGMSAAANRGSLTQQRTGGGINAERQGGLEQLAAVGFPDDGPRIAEQALQLLDAPECPQGTRDLLLMPEPDGAADPREHRPPAGAGPHPGRRAQLRRHQLRHPGDVRPLPLRVGAAQRHLRPGHSRRARQLRLRRRGHARRRAAT